MKKYNQGFFKNSHALRKFYFSRNFQPDQSLTTRTKPICSTLFHLKSRSNYFLKNFLTLIRVKRTFSKNFSQKFLCDNSRTHQTKSNYDNRFSIFSLGNYNSLNFESNLTKQLPILEISPKFLSDRSIGFLDNYELKFSTEKMAYSKKVLQITTDLKAKLTTLDETSSLPKNFNNSDYNNSTHDFGNEVDISSVAPPSIILTPNESPNTTPIGIPDLTPTVTPPGSPTVPQAAYQTVMSVETDFQLDSDHDDEDSDDDSPSLFQSTSTAPWTSMEAQNLRPSIPPRAPAIFASFSLGHESLTRSWPLGFLSLDDLSCHDYTMDASLRRMKTRPPRPLSLNLERAMLRSRLLLTSQTLTPVSLTEARGPFPKDPNEPCYFPHSSHRDSSTPSPSTLSSLLAMRRRPSTRKILPTKKRWLKRTCQHADYHRRRNASLTRLLTPYFNENRSPVDHDTLNDDHESLRASNVDDCEPGDLSNENTPVNSSVTSSPPRLKLDFGTLSHGPWAPTSTETPTMNIEHDCSCPPIDLDCKVKPAPTSINGPPTKRREPPPLDSV